MFIVFEGGDGSGKSTQSRLLAESLKARGMDVVLTREPGGTPGAEEIRGLLLGGADGAKWSAETELLLFNAARRDHVERVIRPALARGGVVICDRFVGSTIAYQGVRGKDLAEKAKRLHAEMIGVNPDLTFLLDRPAADASVETRGMDRMEIVQAAFRSNSRKQFCDLLTQDPSWVGVFTEDLEATRNLIDNIVADRLSGHGFGKDAGPRVFMDEGYFVSLNPLIPNALNKLVPATLFDSETRQDVLAFGDEAQNPFSVGVQINYVQTGTHKDVGAMTPMVNGQPIAFLDMDPEEVETRIYERIEADIPDLMDAYSGAACNLTAEPR